MNLKKLLLFTIAFVLMLFSQANASNVETVKAAIVKHSVEMGVDPAITLSLAKAESGYRHEARSSRGAVGVFQLMPSTARRMGFNPYSMDDNIKAGIMYYKSMFKMFGSMEKAIAAYNAGPVAVKKYNAVPPFSETKRFVSQIMKDYYYLKAHTDPAVVAYNKKLEQEKIAAAKAKAAKEQRSVQPVQTKISTEEMPKINVSSQVVATAPQTAPKAPVPIGKTINAGQTDILDSVTEPDINANSVDI